jgi:hypothetical protein
LSKSDGGWAHASRDIDDPDGESHRGRPQSARRALTPFLENRPRPLQDGPDRPVAALTAGGIPTAARPSGAKPATKVVEPAAAATPAILSSNPLEPIPKSGNRL